ncbi:hypothetical protein T439DRAFT_270382, partial [Meredithblackwellia eburnea MCA 4105]
LVAFSLVELIVAAIVVPYELEHFGGYNGSAAELAFAGGLATVGVPFTFLLAKRRPASIIATAWFECAWCGIGALSSDTVRLLDCQSFFICRGFSTMLGFGWVSWIILNLLGGMTFILIMRRWSGKEYGVWS